MLSFVSNVIEGSFRNSQLKVDLFLKHVRAIPSNISKSKKMINAIYTFVSKEIQNPAFFFVEHTSL